MTSFASATLHARADRGAPLPGPGTAAPRRLAALLLAAVVAGYAPSPITAQSGTAGAWQREAHPLTASPHGIGPHGLGEIRIEQLLQAFGWDTLRARCRDRSVYERDYCSAESRPGRDSLLVYHEIRFPDRTNARVTSFGGRVIRYSVSRGDITGTQLDARYFNPTLWTEYAHRALGPTGEGLRTAPEAYPATVVEAYYHLLGVEVNREYGWICEYSTVGMAPRQRVAAMRVAGYAYSDLLRRLLRAPDVETRLYAADALLYLGGQEREVRKGLKGATKAELQEILGQYRLTAEDLRLIGKLRRSDEMVRTCGNSGSYKIYLRPAREVLDEDAVRRIPARYAEIKRMGYQ